MNHLPGVTELNTVDIYETPLWVLLVLIGCIILVVAIVTIVMRIQNSKWILGLGISGIIIVIVTGVLGIMSTFGTFDVYSHTEYEVTVDETVNVNEFNDTYETIKQRGKIYVVRFKDSEGSSK